MKSVRLRENVLLASMLFTIGAKAPLAGCVIEIVVAFCNVDILRNIGLSACCSEISGTANQNLESTCAKIDRLEKLKNITVIITRKAICKNSYFVFLFLILYNLI